MGKLFVIEGLDGSGKATQADILYQKLLSSSNNVLKVSFPDYDSNSSALVKMYLAGEFGANPDDVNAYAASAFYSVDRYASWKTNWQEFYENDGIVVADRYTTSNAIHQCSKLPEEDWQTYVQWLEDFEYKKMGIPKPDLVLYLDVAPEVSQQLLNKRYAHDETKKDIHENNLSYLQHCQKAALWCAENSGWKRIECTKNNTMLTKEEIAEKVLQITKEAL